MKKIAIISLVIIGFMSCNSDFPLNESSIVKDSHGRYYTLQSNSIGNRSFTLTQVDSSAVKGF